MLRRNSGRRLRREALLLQPCPARPKTGPLGTKALADTSADSHGAFSRSAVSCAPHIPDLPSFIRPPAVPPMWSRVRPPSAGTRWRTAPCSGEVGVDAEVVLGAGDVQTPVHGAAEGPSANRPRQRRRSAQSWKRWRECMSSHTTPTPCNTAPNGSSRQWRELPSQSPSSPGRPLTCRRAHGTEFLLLGR